VWVRYSPQYILKDIKGIWDKLIGAVGGLCAGGTGRAPVKTFMDFINNIGIGSWG